MPTTSHRGPREAVAAVGVVLLVALLAACGSPAAPAPRTAPMTAPTSAGVGTVGKVIGSYRLPGGGAGLVVTSVAHPRGGHQLHVYVAPASEIRQYDGGAALPFVAADTAPTVQASIRCLPSGLVVTVATAGHADAGGPSWRVRRTTYRIADGAAVETHARLVAASVPASDLSTRFPDVAAEVPFNGCSATGG